MTRTDALAAARAARKNASGSKRCRKSLIPEKEIAKEVSRVPSTWQGVFRKALEGGSKAAAVKAKCGDCTNWQRKEIEECTVVGCPLWPYRPFQGKKEA